MDDQEMRAFQQLVSKDLEDATRWTKLWSFIHHAFLFGGVVLSAAAAVTLQLEISTEQIPVTNLATLLAGAAALTTTIAGSGGFDRKWRTNRLIKVRLAQLGVDLMNPDVEAATIRQHLKDIARLRYEGIVGSEPAKTS